MSVGREIYDARQAASMTLRKLAELIGVSAPFLCDVEHDRRRLSVDKVRLATEALGIEFKPHWASKKGRPPMSDATKRAEAVMSIVAVLVQHEECDRTAILDAVKSLIASAPADAAPAFSSRPSMPLGTAAR